MNPIHESTTTAEVPSKKKLEVFLASASQACNNSVENRDQKVSPFYGDTTMIKYVIGATSNNYEPPANSILKKTSTSQVPTTTTLLTSTSIVKTIARPDTIVKTYQQSASSTWSECKQPTISSATTTGKHSIIISTSSNQQVLSEKSATYGPSIVKRPLPMLQPKIMSSTGRSFGVPASAQSHSIFKTMNGNQSGISLAPELSPPSSLLSRTFVEAKKLPMKSVPLMAGKHLELAPIQNPISNNRRSSETSLKNNNEFTQISSTVTLTKTALAAKQAKSLPSPLVTIEKKGSTISLLNYPKQGKSIFGNGNDSSRISLDESIETGQKSLLIKQSSPPTNATAKTPPRVLTTRPRQQSLLKVNSLARLLHTSPRTKRSKSMTSMGNLKKRKRQTRKGRRLSTASDSELFQKAEAEKEKKNSPPAVSESLLCNDKEEKIPSSSSNSSCYEITPKKDPQPNPTAAFVNPFQLNTVLEMLSAFNMLSWKERIGVCKESNMKFHLNEFNLIQIAEKCSPRDQIPERPIFERDTSSKTSDYSDPLYFCRRCECHGAAVDFLAPGFCSYDCFRRESRKRSRATIQYREKMVRERFKKLKKPPITNEAEYHAQNMERLAPKRFFTWSSYLSANNAQPAPIDFFINPFPSGGNLFEIGMKLEAIDPEHNSLFCVCTVIEKKGYRLKLKFDGYSKIHNFWVNADSMDIFPPGWCAKTNRVLQPPKGMNLLSFNWPTYLSSTKSSPAPRSLFTHLNSSSTINPFKVGMRLEADDLKNTGKVCVATVADVLDNRVLVHFDGWDESYDYWIDINSPYIHPIGWHKQHGLELVPPPDWDEYFDWPEYLEFMRSEAALPKMFSKRDPIEFSAGMKLEVVDIKNHSLIRPATVVCRKDYKLLIHFDGWHEGLTFWVNDDSPDIHPIKWCAETRHDLEAPPGFEQIRSAMPCPMYGCRGIGHATRIDVGFHANMDTCPYEPKNFKLEIEKPSRIDEVGRFVYNEDAVTIVKQEIEDQPCHQDEKTKIETEKTLSPPQYEQQQKLRSSDVRRASIREEKQTPPPPPSDKEIKIASEYLCDYGPRLKQNYMIWRDNSNFNPSAIKKNPLEWTTKETAQYITSKCHPIGHLFQREDIDGVALLNMHQSDLTDILKVKLGPSIKIYSHILHLRNQVVTRFFKPNQQSTDTENV